MGMKYIRDSYGVPAKRGGRIKFSPYIGEDPVFGVIVGSKNRYLCVRMDGELHTKELHPKWKVEYL